MQIHTDHCQASFNYTMLWLKFDEYMKSFHSYEALTGQVRDGD